MGGGGGNPLVVGGEIACHPVERAFGTHAVAKTPRCATHMQLKGALSKCLFFFGINSLSESKQVC